MEDLSNCNSFFNSRDMLSNASILSPKLFNFVSSEGFIESTMVMYFPQELWFRFSPRKCCKCKDTSGHGTSS